MRTNEFSVLNLQNANINKAYPVPNSRAKKERRWCTPVHKASRILGLALQSDSKLLSGFPWPINGNHDNNLESSCISMSSASRTSRFIPHGIAHVPTKLAVGWT
jgi:hypothetical protein